MLFNSIEFLYFFPLVVGLYFILPFRFRWLFLLLASYTFYGLANGLLLLLIVASTLIDYLAGIKMDDIDTKKGRKPFVILSLISNLGILCLFKYYNFFNDSFANLFQLLNIPYLIPSLSIALPVGISFYTFQTMSYSIDVYKGKIKAEKHLGYFALYVTYFPQLVAGPIEKASNLLPQFKTKQNFDYKRITDGLKLMTWGFFKKVVIADQISPMIKYVTDSPEQFNGFSVLLCSCLFVYQIYCDFSAYSDIAIGGAQVMGVKLMENFRRPFFAKSLSDLWSRWHISLINWFQEYIFFPLGGSKKGRRKAYRNVMIVFLVSGLWHGASYNFLIWGLLNGLVIVLTLRLTKLKSAANKKLGSFINSVWYRRFLRVKTYIIFAILGILFYTNDLNSAHLLGESLFHGWTDDIRGILMNLENERSHILYLGKSAIQVIALVLAIFILEWVHYFQEYNGSMREFVATKPALVRWLLYIGVTLIIMAFSFDQEIPFIYFQF